MAPKTRASPVFSQLLHAVFHLFAFFAVKFGVNSYLVSEQKMTCCDYSIFGTLLNLTKEVIGKEMFGIFLDIETTGLDPYRHRPIDFACKVIDLRTGKLIGEYQSLIKISSADWQKSDPDSLEINGYTWEQIQKGKEISLVSKEIISLFEQSEIVRGKVVYICQNPSFDRPFFAQIVNVYLQERLNWPYHWLDLASMYWTKHQKTIPISVDPVSLSKNTIAENYGIAPEEIPHLAMNGVDHLIECYNAVIGIHQ